MGTAFLPDFHEGSLTIQANTLPGTSLAKSDEIGRRLEQILLAPPEVVATTRRTGRAEFDEYVQGEQSASRRLLVLGVGVVAGLFMLLILAFGRARDAVLIMVNLPVALIGGVGGVFLAGGVLSHWRSKV